MGKLNNSLFSSKDQTWETPQDLFDKFTGKTLSDDFSKELDRHINLKRKLHFRSNVTFSLSLCNKYENNQIKLCTNLLCL